MCTYFNKKTDLAQNLIDDFFSNLTVRGPFLRKDFNPLMPGGNKKITHT